MKITTLEELVAWSNKVSTVLTLPENGGIFVEVEAKFYFKIIRDSGMSDVPDNNANILLTNGVRVKIVRVDKIAYCGDTESLCVNPLMKVGTECNCQGKYIERR